MTVPLCALDTHRLREAIRAMYTRVMEPQSTFHFHRGAEYAVRVLGYNAAALGMLPAEVTGAFSGIGNPLRVGPLRSGMTVVDVGCGAGLDLLLAARAVGPIGRAIGIEMTQAMAARARSGARVAGFENVEVRSGDATALPVAPMLSRCASSPVVPFTVNLAACTSGSPTRRGTRWSSARAAGFQCSRAT